MICVSMTGVFNMSQELFAFADLMVTESNLSESTKLQLGNWLEKEATEAQVKAFILDKRIVHLDKQSEEIVNDRFEALDELGVLTTLWATATFAGIPGVVALVGLLATLGVVAAFKNAQQKAIRDLRACRRFGEGLPGRVCTMIAKRENMRTTARILQSAIGKCSQVKNPEKCQLNLSKKIDKLQEKIKKIDIKLQQARMKGQAVDPAIRKYRAQT